MTIANQSLVIPWQGIYEPQPDRRAVGISSGRVKREVQLSGPDDARIAADNAIASAYKKLLAEDGYNFSTRAPTIPVPAHSTLGRWHSELDNAFKAPLFLEWARKNNVDTHNLILVPSRGEIVGIVQGRPKTFTLLDDSGWSDISRTLLSIGKRFAPEPGQEVQTAYAQGELPMNLVAQFYGEVVSPTSEQVNARLKQFEEAPGLKLPDRYITTHSDAALSEQQQALGDEVNRHALISALGAQVDDACGSIDLETVLIPIDPRSSLFARDKRRFIKVAEVIRLEGNKVPVNAKQALDYAQVLSFDLAHRAPSVESGGARPVGQWLGASSLRKMSKLVEAWKAQGGPQPPSSAPGPQVNSLLNRLISLLPETTKSQIAANPSLAMDQLIRSPKALELGQQIQEKVKLIETPTSAIESVSAALVHELDPNPAKSAFNVAGYNLYSADNAGFSPADIVRRFIAHLEPKVGANAAPLAARLLLSVTAPELLVKDIPPNLVFGSHTWTNFAIEVARIEHQVPGASMNMTFSQVMAFGDAPPISLEGEDQLREAARDPIIAWGIANGVISSKPNNDYTSEEILASQESLNKQQSELKWAKSALNTPPVTRRELALAELKRVLPDVDPTLEVLQAPWVKHKPVSLLDIYMTGPIKPDNWESMDKKKFPYEAIKSRLSALDPDIKKTFSEKFEEYKKVQKSAWTIQFKYQLSLLPLADRERFRNSDVTFYEVSRPYTKTGPCTSGFFTRKVCLPGEPTPAELKELRGGRGIFMTAVGPLGEVYAYSYFPGEGKFVKEDGYPGRNIKLDDRSYFGEDSDGYIPGQSHLYTQYELTNTDRDPPGSLDKPESAYFSKRNGGLGGTVSEFFTKEYDDIKSVAACVTELERGKACDAKLKSFLLSLVPFYDAIQDTRDGNVGGAIFNFGFDILGFIIPGASAARKALKGRKGFFNLIKSTVVASVGGGTGFKDTVDITKNLNKGAGAAFKDTKYLADQGKTLLSRLSGNYGYYDINKVYRDGDIVKGFFLSAEDNFWRPAVAILKKGGWYAYNILTKTPYGLQAAQFGVVSELGN
ncbi:hypothetical protein LVW35_25260 [Pseudomonas sp. HN11]|uniref:hypothetical protein n=1 Tax=Pseudomonas sp. HN11 TaxID=1344094 RepID=UPI001F37C5F6|nr:hypothetical protein [Pseudomonas sp. HN11]UII70912.1 hypothetical protein LVW35_25260 [Pseudomonas sp. HN11]